jgi:hypothetical protein
MIPNTNEIMMFLHCKICLSEKPNDVSPEQFQSVSVGFTELGLQVWCKRHDCNVVHIDFQGNKHPANTTAKLGVLTV